MYCPLSVFFFFNDTATTEIYTLSLHDALPIFCWGATDWFGALGAFAWLPWAWWSLERALDRQRTRWRFLWPAPFVYLVVTGGFSFNLFIVVSFFPALSFKSFFEKKNSTVGTANPARGRYSFSMLGGRAPRPW